MSEKRFTKANKISAMSDRVKLLHENAIKEANKKIPWFGDKLSILDIPGVLDKPVIIRKALAFEKMLNEMPISIKEGELIVGDIPAGSVAGGRSFPSYTNNEEDVEAAKNSLSIKSVWGHVVPDYSKVLSKGLKGLKDEIEGYCSNKLNKLSQEKAEFYEASLICICAVEQLAKRYAKLAQKQTKQEKQTNLKKDYEKIALICSKISENKPESFHEAVQSFFFIFVALHSTLNFVPLGRFDQYIEPFLSKDLNDGLITPVEAQEIIECLWIKLNERTKKNPQIFVDHSDPFDWSTGGNPKEEKLFKQNEDIAYYNQWYQTCVLSGRKVNGSDATNILTYMCLEASKKLKMTQPVLYVRMHKDSPKKLLTKCCELIKDEMSMPTIINDDIRIPALIKFGIPIEEANDYALAGCWESLIPGKTEFRWTPVHALKSLEYVLNRGYDFLLDKQIGPDTGDPSEFTSLQHLLKAFKIQLDSQLGKSINTVLNYYGKMNKIAPVPFLSSLIDDCLVQGLDLTQGGAKYIFHALSITGLANTIDSMMALKAMVFDTKKITMKKYIKIINNNYEDAEDIRLYIKNNIQKYGNDIDETDQILKEIVEYFVTDVKKLTEDIKSKKISFPCMIGTTPMYKLFGRAHIASADGRMAREPIANNLCPTDGVAKNGLTAVINSYTKVNFIDIPMGSELDIHIRKKTLDSSFDGVNLLGTVINSFLDLGGPGLNITVTDVETLIAAQKEPEKYQDLMVRLGGWQAYFVALDKVHQDYIIARNKH